MLSKKRRISRNRKTSIKRGGGGGKTLTRAGLFNSSTRKNHDFENFLNNDHKVEVLDATTSKNISLSYFVSQKQPKRSSAAAEDVAAAEPRATRKSGGVADKMPHESFKLINLQERGGHAHSLVLFKSRAITTNPEKITIFECNGKASQSEIRVLMPDPSKSDGSVIDITETYFSPVSPPTCINYGFPSYNPGYCGIFCMIAMVFFRHYIKTSTPEEWIRKWQLFLDYMRQRIPDEPPTHGSMGTLFASKVQEIIAKHPNSKKGHQAAEKEIMDEISLIIP